MMLNAPSDHAAHGPRAGRTRIACLVHGVGGRGTGVRRLILDQAASWAELDSGVEVGIFVRCEAGTEDAWRGQPIRDSHCLTCSECVNRCPRGVLRFERIPLFVFK